MINTTAPQFDAEALVDNTIKKISLKDYRGKWVILFFYPADFTFVCPTELGELAAKYKEFSAINTEILTISTDTVFVHKAWHDTSETIKQITFPMVADPTHEICKAYGTLIEKEGLSLRATYLIDPDGIVKAYEQHDNAIGRNSDELLRKVQMAQYVQANNGEVCPMNWKPGDKTLKPGLDLVGKI